MQVQSSFSIAAACLDANTAAAFASGVLSESEVMDVEAHVDRCSDCRRYLTALAPSHPAPRGSSWRRLSKGVHIGRYVLEHALGAGGMGIVWAAHDSELDRRVALKMVRGDVSKGEDFQNRLLREAQAMARLTHPNVVTVYDLLVHDRQLVLALELVDGGSLTSWLMSEARSWKDKLRVFLQAGRGLAAAHAVGLVHRDFKPDNVLCARSGRVCVTDFGLARLGALDANHRSGVVEPSRDTSAIRAIPSGKSITLAGTVLGTPRYMAPEQLRGEVADAKSDQFNFCASLHEALYGALPSGVEPKARKRVPAFVYRALVRGMRAASEERYPSMEALLSALSHDPRVKWRRAAITMAAASCLTAAVLLTRQKSAQSTELQCHSMDQKLAGVWDGPKKERTHRAFSATGRPSAEDAWRSAERAIDGYTHDWVAQRTEICETNRAHGMLEPADLRRMECLDERLVHVRALTGVLERADGVVVTNAVAASHSLTPLGLCGDPKSFLGQPPPPEPERAARVADLRSELAHVTALGETQKFKEALPIAKKVVEDASALGYRPLEAQALLVQGKLLDSVLQPIDAEPVLYRAAWVADATGDDRTRAMAWLKLLANIGLRAGSRADAIPFVREQAIAARERLRGDQETEIRYLEALAAVAAGPGNYAEARARQLELIALLDKTYGVASWRYATALDGLARYEQLLGDYDAALQTLERARAALERAGVPENGLIAHVESGEGKALLQLLRFPEAESHFRKAIAIQEMDDRETQRLVVPVYDLGRALAEQGRYEEAVAAYDRALALQGKYLPPEHPQSFEFLVARAAAEVVQGRAWQVVAVLKRIVEDDATAHASWRPDAQFLLARALTQCHIEAHHARQLAEAAREGLRKWGKGPRHDRELASVEAWLAHHP